MVQLPALQRWVPVRQEPRQLYNPPDKFIRGILTETTIHIIDSKISEKYGVSGAILELREAVLKNDKERVIKILRSLLAHMR